ncbi:MAG: hypothetical protein VX278_24055 [Myxococcota bacterium]|nr:hypothetical protein [Myxococcota bacterium]
MSKMLQRLLPNQVVQSLPELHHIVRPVETYVNCSSCRLMCNKGDAHQKWYFNDKTKCCTFYPKLHNWQLGRIFLSDSPRRHTLIREEMIRSNSYNALGLHPPEDYLQKQVQSGYPESFGKAAELLCPFYEKEMRGCSIWEYQNTVCRSWFCKHEEGSRGLGFWNSITMLGSYYEKIIAIWCIEQYDIPCQSPMDIHDHIDWYKRCAQYVETIPESAIQEMRSDFVEDAIQHICKYYDDFDRPMPNILRSAVSKFEFRDEEVILMGYSEFARIITPRSIFRFLSKLDGIRTWREALRESNQEGANLSEELIVHMFKQDMLSPYHEEDFQVGMRISVQYDDDVLKMTAPIPDIEIYGVPKGASLKSIT